jgi:TusA-related sulfurtransferase
LNSEDREVERMQAVVERLVEAVSSRDGDGLRSVVGPAARMRALIPPGPVESEGPDEIVERFATWFGWLSSVELVGSSIEGVADRWHFSYRLRVRTDEGESMLIEQQGFCDVAEGSVTGLDLVCSGFRPIGSGTKHTFDAGTLGCADGLAQEFRRRIGAVDVGDVLAVIARDPAAKEDLPSLARLGGHKVLSTEAHDDGRLTIEVERGR